MSDQETIPRRFEKQAAIQRTSDEANNSTMHQDAPRKGCLLTYLSEYTSNTSLHGLKYICDSSRCILERVFWVGVFLLSVCTCSFLIKNLWLKWDQSPVIFSFGEKMTPVWQLAFPAITICSKNKVPRSMFNYSRQYEEYYKNRINISEMHDKIEALSLLCAVDARPEQLYGNRSIMDHIMSVVPSINRTMSYCEVRGNPGRCDIMFSRVITHKGVCHSFNSLSEQEIFRNENIQHDYAYSEEKQHSKGWTMEGGYSDNSNFEAYPLRGRNFGSRPDLYVQLTQQKSDIDHLCDGPITGHEVIVHNPAETSLSTQFHFEVKPDTDLTFAIIVQTVSTSENLKNYAPTSRQCFFPTERYLRYFAVYTQKNCELECQSNFTFASCKCVPFYLPHNDSNFICTARSSDCVEDSNDDLAKRMITIGGYESGSDSRQVKEGLDGEALLDNIAKSCSCLPTCIIASYDAVTTVAQYNNMANYAKAFDNLFDGFTDITDQLKNITLSGLSFYFKESQYISMRRSELYGHTDFLANCGGLLGLFLGFSVLSLVEIFYFMSFRWCCVITKARTLNVAEDKQKNREEF